MNATHRPFKVLNLKQTAKTWPQKGDIQKKAEVDFHIF